jgi:hypothetical protein
MNDQLNIALRELNIDILLKLVPELKDTIGCEQNNPGHDSDVFQHTLRFIERIPMDSTLRMAALLTSIPIPEQEEVVRRVDKLLALADKIDLRYKNAKTQLERAEKAIYVKAFRGELVKHAENNKLN